jgi:hypothetical protein
VSLPIQLPRWGEAMRKTLGIKGRSPSLSLLEDIMPVYEIGETAEPDQHYLKDEHLGAGYIVVVAQAAVFSGGAVVNPFGSNKIVTVEAFRVNCAVPYAVTLFNGPVGNLNSFTQLPIARDTRNSDNTGTPLKGQVRMGERRGTFLPNAGAINAGGLDNRIYEIPFVLTPNWFLMAQAGTVNTAIDFMCWYQERDIMPEDQQG